MSYKKFKLNKLKELCADEHDFTFTIEAEDIDTLPSHKRVYVSWTERDGQPKQIDYSAGTIRDFIRQGYWVILEN